MLLRIYLLFSAISNALLGVHLVRRGRRRLMWMRLMHEEYEFWRERNLFYQAEIGFHDLMDWIDAILSERREARRIVLKKKSLKNLRIRVRTRIMNARKSHDDEHLQKSDASDFIGDQRLDRLTSVGPLKATLIIMGIFFVIFEIASHLEDPSGFVHFITGASIAFALVAIGLRLASKELTGYCMNADISADIIGRIILEEETKPEPVTECSDVVQKAKVSAVDVELKAIKETRSRKKNRKRRR